MLRLEHDPDANAATPIAERLLRRVDRMWRRYEETGEDRWLTAAIEANRLYMVARRKFADTT